MPQLKDFEGDWRLTRRVIDRAGDHCVRFCGTARFTPDAGGLAYEERGKLYLPGQPPLDAQRRYHWRAAAGRIIVDHGDGRPFHGFDPAVPAAHHACPPDSYAVRYRFDRWPRWSATWTVTGPRKDYTLLSRFAPLMPPSAADRTDRS